MKSAEEMMCDWIQSQLVENEMLTTNSEQYLEIYNWYQSVQLAQEKQRYYAYKYYARNGQFPCMIMPTNETIIKWTGNEDAWKHAHGGGNMRYAKRVDGNHHEIIQGLRDCGYTVKDTSKYGDGFPDCIVAGGGRVVMLEIKQGSAKLTDVEKEFHDTFHGLGVYVTRTLEDALKILEREKI